MLFIDPIELLRLRLPLKGNLEPSDVAVARERLLTALATKGYNKVRYRGVNLDLQVALHAIQRLEDPVQLAFFCDLHRTSQMRAFLRKPSLATYLPFRRFPSEGKRILCDHFKGELHQAFSRLLATLLQNYEWNACRFLLDCPRWMYPESHAIRLQPLIQTIQAGLVHWKRLATAQGHEVYDLLNSPYLSIALTRLVDRLAPAHATLRQEWADQIIAAVCQLNRYEFYLYAFKAIQLPLQMNISSESWRRACKMRDILYPKALFILSGQHAGPGNWREAIQDRRMWFLFLISFLFCGLGLFVLVMEILEWQH